MPEAAPTVSHFATLFRATPQPAFLLDSAGRILNSNPSSQALSPLGPEESWGHHFTEFLLPESLQAAEAAFARAVAGDAASVHCAVHGPRGEANLWDVHLAPVCQHRGVCCVLGIVHDVTTYVREQDRLRREQDEMRQRLHRRPAGMTFIGEDPRFREIVALLDRVASEDTPVLLEGETGTGKELAAAYVHECSGRAAAGFVAVNCAGLAESLIESELFGHAAGAFTGAQAAKPGLFEVADRGTLLLDEIGELSPGMQAKLLRVLETRSFRRLGETAERTTDFRLVAATNRDLRAMVKRGEFRADLFYRLHVFPITLPPLRERTGDIPRLARHFLRHRHARRDDVLTLTPAALDRLCAYPWPGNVRELKHVIERAALLCPGRLITPSVLEAAGPLPHPQARRLRARKGRHSREEVCQALAQAQNNRAETARILGVHRRQLYRLLDRYGLSGRHDAA